MDFFLRVTIPFAFELEAEHATSSQKEMMWPEKWPEKCAQILHMIADDMNVTILELEKHLNLGHTTIKKMLRELQKEGFLRRVGADKGGHWEIVKERD